MPFLPELLTFRNPVFVETGTYQGDTTQQVATSGQFERILSMELSPHYHAHASNQLRGFDNVQVILGNSRTDLWDVMKDITVPITFWLDAHWSGVPYIGEDGVTRCPVLSELQQIMRHPIKTHTIMIDDVRLMDGEHFPVRLPEIEEALKRINPNYVLTYFDDYTAPNDVLVAHLPAHTE